MSAVGSSELARTGVAGSPNGSAADHFLRRSANSVSGMSTIAMATKSRSDRWLRARIHLSAATPSSRTASDWQLGKAVAGNVRLVVVRPHRRQPSASGRCQPTSPGVCHVRATREGNQRSAAVTDGHSPSLTRTIVGPGQPAGREPNFQAGAVSVFLGVRELGLVSGDNRQ